MKIYVLLECWHESDGWLVDDTFVAASADVAVLVKRAEELARGDAQITNSRVPSEISEEQAAEMISSRKTVCLPDEPWEDESWDQGVLASYRIIEVDLLEKA